MTLPAGLYERLLTHGLAQQLAALPEHFQRDLAAVDPAEAPYVLARYVHDTLVRSLKSTGDLSQQVLTANDILRLLANANRAVDEDDEVHDGPEQLLALSRKTGVPTKGPQRPAIPLSNSALLVNAPHDHRIGHEICSELESSDRVDLLCSFLKWTGQRVVREALQAFLDRGGRMRVLTTCYMGATDRRVLDDLVALGRASGPDPAVEVRVSYDTRRTRLHAKAWLFHRHTGYSTAYIGSSNLSHSALLEGVEWNVRVSGVDAPNILEKFRATFDSYWEDGDFEGYLPERDAVRFDRAVAVERRTEEEALLPSIDVHPYAFQLEILEKLQAERTLHGHYKNLVVAATGTGKTMIAAFDYRRVREELGRQSDRLLFVAHRDHILKQSLTRFRIVLKENSFGELWVGGSVPGEGRHVFASVQTLAHQDLAQLDPQSFDVIIVDEFHHAEAPTYTRLLQHFQPKLLIGLTATPERADGRSIMHWFDGRVAAQLRLWHALERLLLSPFQYFGIADGTDLSSLKWSRGAYDTLPLERLYTGDQARTLRILQAVHRHVLDVRHMRALGFCVSVAHARFMAAEFTRKGIPSLAVTGDTPARDRDDTLRALKERDINVIFSVDVFSEGIDIPEVDTVLLLRPTESATVFQQQLGRGLRLHDSKSCLTVLDFIGQAHRRFRFDLRYATLVPGTRAEVRHQVEAGFPFLPSGCTVQLEREAQQTVVENLRASIQQGGRWLVEELRGLGPDVTLGEFLQRAELDVRDVYGSGRSWTQLRRRAGLEAGPATEEPLLNTLSRVLHIDDPERLRFYREVLKKTPDAWDARTRRSWTMLHLLLFPGRARPTLEDGLAQLLDQPAVTRELTELLDVLEGGLTHLTHPLDVPDVPLRVHGTYSLDEILAAFGRLTADTGTRIREGVLWDEPTGWDLLFVTLQKTEKHYSPSTMYRDYALSPSLFHWESQSVTRADSPTGRRYRQPGRALLFVRDTVKGPYGMTNPYVLAGPATYVSHEGERPMAVVWRLLFELPPAVFERARVAA